MPAQTIIQWCTTNRNQHQRIVSAMQGLITNLTTWRKQTRTTLTSISCQISPNSFTKRKKILQDQTRRHPKPTWIRLIDLKMKKTARMRLAVSHNLTLLKYAHCSSQSWGDLGLTWEKSSTKVEKCRFTSTGMSKSTSETYKSSWVTSSYLNNSLMRRTRLNS